LKPTYALCVNPFGLSLCELFLVVLVHLLRALAVTELWDQGSTAKTRKTRDSRLLFWAQRLVSSNMVCLENFYKNCISYMGKYGKLVGGIPTPLKNMKVSLDDYSQYMEKTKMFQTTNQKIVNINRGCCNSPCLITRKSSRLGSNMLSHTIENHNIRDMWDMKDLKGIAWN